MMLEAGAIAPDFALPDDGNHPRKLSDYKGKMVLLYFYPKDDTTGCTTEACNFRDDYSAYITNDVAVLGVSPDSVASHGKFKQKYTLPFPLLADEGHKICNLYGVWGPKKYLGREYEGVLRTSFLIDPQGRIMKVFKNVKPPEHSADVIAEIKKVKV